MMLIEKFLIRNKEENNKICRLTKIEKLFGKQEWKRKKIGEITYKKKKKYMKIQLRIVNLKYKMLYKQQL